MNTMKEFEDLVKAKEEIVKLEKEYQNDWGRNYAVIDEDLKIARAHFESLKLKTIFTREQEINLHV